METRDKSSVGFIYISRAILIFMLLAGAVGSLIMMFEAGSQQKSVFLMVLFTGWVLAPFIAIAAAVMISQRWSVPVRTSLYILALLVIVNSLIAYSGFYSPPGTKTAFVFLVVPFISLIVGLVLVIVARMLRRR